MPHLTILGWAHTLLSLISLAAGIYLLLRVGEIRSDQRLGKLFLGATALTALTALAIHERTVFGPGHVLAVLALGAIGFGLVVGRGATVGSWRHVLSALAFSFTLLCQLIPGSAETLTRFPAGSPMVSGFNAPELQKVFLGLVVAFGVLALSQLIVLRRRRNRS